MYDYRREETADIIETIRSDYAKDLILAYTSGTADEFIEKLNDELWIDDSVTGNASGSYTCNSYKAGEYLHNNGDLLREALREFCVDSETVADKFMNEDWEYFDVTIRCYILYECIESAVNVLFDELEAVRMNTLSGV